MIVLYPGSFDPPHFGHLDLIRRAASIAERVIVGVAVHPEKRPHLSPERRVELIAGECADLGNVRVISYSGQTVAFARAQGATCLMRGLRSAPDVERERGTTTTNRIAGGLDTLFLLGDGRFAHLSSTLVREAAAARMPLDTLVPKRVAVALAER